MSREMRFGEDAGNEIIKAVRETNRRMRNAEPYRGRWFNHAQPVTPADLESCCCPKCVSKPGDEACCDCLPQQVCLAVIYGGVIVGQAVVNWADGDVSKTATISIVTAGGACSLEVTVTNGYGPSGLYATPDACGFWITTSDVCVTMPPCGLWQAVECATWATGTGSITWDAVTAACGTCLVGEITFQMTPGPLFRPKCRGCSCAPEWLCARIDDGASNVITTPNRVRQVGGEWTFPFTINCDEYSVSVKIGPNCLGQCVMKLNGFGVTYDDEAQWQLLEACPTINSSWTVTIGEVSHTLTVTGASCDDCHGCCLPGGLASITVQTYGTSTGARPGETVGAVVLIDTRTIPWICAGGYFFANLNDFDDTPTYHEINMSCSGDPYTSGRYFVSLYYSTWWGGNYTSQLDIGGDAGFDCETMSGRFEFNNGASGYYHDAYALVTA